MQNGAKQFGKNYSNIYSGSFGRPDIEPAASGFPGAVSFSLGITACGHPGRGLHSGPTGQPLAFPSDTSSGLFVVSNTEVGCPAAPAASPRRHRACRPSEAVCVGAQDGWCPQQGRQPKRTPAPLFSVEKTGYSRPDYLARPPGIPKKANCPDFFAENRPMKQACGRFLHGV